MEMEGQQDIAKRFAAMLERHRHMLQLICLHFAGGDLERSRDMMQEVQAVLWRRREKLRPGATPMEEAAWVMWQARSVSAHERRRQRVKPVLMGSTADLPPELLTTGDGDNAAHRLAALAEKLDSQDRQLLDFLVEGYSIQEIAVTLHLSSTTAYRRRQRLVENLRRIAQQPPPRSGF